MRERYNIVYCSVKEVVPIFIRFSGTPPVLIFDLFNLRERGADTVTREPRQFFPSIFAKHNGCSWRHASNVWGWFWLSRGKGLRRMFQSLIFPKHEFHSWCKCSSCWITISSTQAKIDYSNFLDHFSLFRHQAHKKPSTIFAAIELIVLFLSDDVNTVKTLQ